MEEIKITKQPCSEPPNQQPLAYPPVQPPINIMDNDSITVCGVQYTFCGVIGEGAAGIVYLTRNQQGQYFAIKSVKNYDNPITRTLTDNEIEIQKKFKGNPFVIQYIGVQTTRKFAHIVLEIGSCSLRNVIDHKEIREREFLFIVCNVCEGLQSIHESQVIHRDIKPENIIFKDGIYKITDFGVSCDKAEDDSFSGTMLYMAPEVLSMSETAVFTNKVDVWSMGVLAFQVLFNYHPFIMKPSESRIRGNKREIEQLRAVIKELAEPSFTMEKYLERLTKLKMNKEAEKVKKKMSIMRKEVIENLCLFFETDPNKREDISYFYFLFLSLRDSMTEPIYKKVKINPKTQTSSIPLEIRMFINTLNLVYELDAQSPNEELVSDVTFSIELAIWFLTGVTYGNVHYIIPEHLVQLKKHLKPKDQVCSDISRGILPYYFWLKGHASELEYFDKLNVLRLHLVMTAYWKAIIDNDTKFCRKIKRITNFEIFNPLEMFQFVQMYSERNINEIEEMILGDFSF